jgi:hypothetical protein
MTNQEIIDRIKQIATATPTRPHWTDRLIAENVTAKTALRIRRLAGEQFFSATPLAPSSGKAKRFDIVLGGSTLATQEAAR